MIAGEEQFEPHPEQNAARPPRRRLFPLAGILVLAAAFAGALWYAYRAGVQAGSDSLVPLITAEQGPVKVRPTEPGGLEVPHQNVLVYDRFAPQQNKRVVEQLLPRPEEPIARSAIPLPPPGAAEAAGSPGSDAASPDPAAPIDEGVTRLPGEGAPPSGRDGQQPAPPTSVAMLPPTSQPAASTGFRVQLAAVRSESEAREVWERLQKTYPGLLGTLQPQVARTDLGTGRGVYYRLQAGPLSEKTLAEMLCGSLKSRKVECLVVQP